MEPGTSEHSIDCYLTCLTWGSEYFGIWPASKEKEPSCLMLDVANRLKSWILLGKYLGKVCTGWGQCLSFSLVCACWVASAMSDSSQPCSPPDFSVHRILQARILEWVAMPFSRGSSRPRNWTHVSCVPSIAGRFITAEPPRKPFSLITDSILSTNESKSESQFCCTLDRQTQISS